MTSFDERQAQRAQLEEFERLVEELRRAESSHLALAKQITDLRKHLLEILGSPASEEARRKYLRIPCRFEVRLSSESARTIAGIVTDISPGGMFVLTQESLMVGEKVQIALNSPRALQLGAKVTWRRPTRPYGAGLQLLPTKKLAAKVNGLVLELLLAERRMKLGR